MLVITKAKASQMLKEIENSFVLVEYSKGYRHEIHEFQTVEQAIAHIKTVNGVTLKTSEVTVCVETNNGCDYEKIASVKVC